MSDTTHQADVLHVPQMARKLGRTEASIRTAVNRGDTWLPPPFRQGRRICWRAVDVDAFLAKQAGVKT